MFYPFEREDKTEGRYSHKTIRNGLKVQQLSKFVTGDDTELDNLRISVPNNNCGSTIQIPEKPFKTTVNTQVRPFHTD